jgi:periplasmic divalent cation tolerance protein
MVAPDGSDAVMAFTTLESPDAARVLVERLVEQRIVACGTIVPAATSVYRWEGTITAASEALVLLKTTRDRWPALRAAVDRDHPYRVPELLAVPVVGGLPAYLAWVHAETTPEGAP